MTDIYSFLFLARDGQISAYRRRQFHDKPDKFELIPAKGRAFQTLNADFWTWWRDRMDYVSGSEVDFAFLTTDGEAQDFFLPLDFKHSVQTRWTQQAVCQFLDGEESLQPYALREAGREVRSSCHKDANVFCLTRFNVFQEPVQLPRNGSILYDSMREDPLPPDFVDRIKKC